MSLFASPQLITPKIFAELPQKFRRSDAPAERVARQTRRAAGRPLPRRPVLRSRRQHLYVTGIPYGRIFRISPKAERESVTEYDGELNGLKIHKDGRIFVIDHKRGLLLLDAHRGCASPPIERHNLQHFKGLSYLFFASNGGLHFTDQRQTGLQDPSGRVYRLQADSHTY